MLYLSRDGQTAKIAHFLASRIPNVELMLLSDWLGRNNAQNVAKYSAVVVGAPVRYGHFSRDLYRFARQFSQVENPCPVAFFGVNLTARKPEKNTPETNPYMRKFLQKTANLWQPNPCAVFAGALRYHRYHFWDRRLIQLIMKLTGGDTDLCTDCEYTDWQAVERFADKIKQAMLGE